MKGCHTTGGRKYAILKPIGFNETAIVNVQQSCACQYGDSTGHKRVWAEETSPDSEESQCGDSNCSSNRDTLPSGKCRQHQDQPICSGQGNCIDGKCFCYKNKLGKVYGKYCEMDDFSCPYHQGTLCSGKLQHVCNMSVFSWFVLFSEATVNDAAENNDIRLSRSRVVCAELVWEMFWTSCLEFTLLGSVHHRHTHCLLNFTTIF